MRRFEFLGQRKAFLTGRRVRFKWRSYVWTPSGVPTRGRQEARRVESGSMFDAGLEIIFQRIEELLSSRNIE